MNQRRSRFGARADADPMISPMARANAPETARLSSVANALCILDMLDECVELRVVDVSRTLGIASSTAHRLLSALRRQGYLRQEDGSSRYLPGHALLRLARQLNTEYALERIALPHLQDLRDELNETVNLEVLLGGEVLFLASAEDQHRLRVATRAGSRGPAHANAGGKLLLAQLTPDEIRARVGENPAALTANTHVALDDLIAELQAIRLRGYALNNGETDEGVNAVAVPVLDPDGFALAALSVAAPSSRLPLVRVPTVLPHLQAASMAISASYFGRPQGRSGRRSGHRSVTGGTPRGHTGDGVQSP